MSNRALLLPYHQLIYCYKENVNTEFHFLSNQKSKKFVVIPPSFPWGIPLWWNSPLPGAEGNGYVI